MSFLLRLLRWLAAPIALIGAAVMALRLLSSRKNKISNMRDAVEVQKSLREIRKKRAASAEFMTGVREDDLKIAALNKEVAASQRRVLELTSFAKQGDFSGLSDDDVAIYFHGLDL